MAVKEKALGPDHPEVALLLNNLALLYQVQGRYADAVPLYKRALAIREKALGPDHPDVAGSLNNLAELYRAEGRNAEAERLLLPISTHAASTRNRAEAAYDLGLLALRAHNPELALARLSSAVTDASAITRTLADALLLRSISLLQLRRVTAASADFARYSELARTAAAVSGERLALVQQVRGALLQAGATAPPL